MHPSKNALARSYKKVFFLAFLQDPARSCGILQEPYTKFLQNPERLQECKKKDLFLEDLARAFSLQGFHYHCNV